MSLNAIAMPAARERGRVAEAVEDGGDLVRGRCRGYLALAGWGLAPAGGCPVALLVGFSDPSGDQVRVGAESGPLDVL